MQSIQSAAGLALLLGAASTAAFTLPPTRRGTPRTRISATNEDWRQACDSDGVVSYYDYGVRLGGADSDAAVAASSARRQRRTVQTSGSISGDLCCILAKLAPSCFTSASFLLHKALASSISAFTGL